MTPSIVLAFIFDILKAMPQLIADVKGIIAALEAKAPAPAPAAATPAGVLAARAKFEADRVKAKEAAAKVSPK